MIILRNLQSIGTENSIHIVPLVGFEPESPEVDCKARHHIIIRKPDRWNLENQHH